MALMPIFWGLEDMVRGNVCYAGGRCESCCADVDQMIVDLNFGRVRSGEVGVVATGDNKEKRRKLKRQ